MSAKPVPDPRNVNVNFLPNTVTQKDLRTCFERFGPILSTKIVYSQLTGEHMGYGFVTFASEESAKKAIAAMNNTELHGKRIKVCQARGPNPHHVGTPSPAPLAMSIAPAGVPAVKTPPSPPRIPTPPSPPTPPAIVPVKLISLVPANSPLSQGSPMQRDVTSMLVHGPMVISMGSPAKHPLPPPSSHTPGAGATNLNTEMNIPPTVTVGGSAPMPLRLARPSWPASTVVVQPQIVHLFSTNMLIPQQQQQQPSPSTPNQNHMWLGSNTPTGPRM